MGTQPADDRTASYQTTRLAPGRHDRPGATVCVMELASMLAGERFSDRPISVCPIVGGILRAYNDNVDEDRRHDLYRYAAESVGTRGDFKLQLRRAQIAIAWARHRHDERRRLFSRAPAQPRPDDGPDAIGFYVIGSVIHRLSDESHAEVLALLDELIETGLEQRLPSAVGAELLEHVPHPVEHGRGGAELGLAELAQGGAPAGVVPGSSLLDQPLAAVGQRDQDHAPVPV
jgi:hypothetical protein